MASTEREAGRVAAVVGRPIEHSLSPVLHRAAYRALGLASWEYRRIECGCQGLADLVTSLDERWSGLSVTMPCKRAALEVAAEATPRARLVGAANTLIPTHRGWRADCTDVDGVSGALRAAGCALSGRAVLLGAGGTAAAALAALADMGVTEVSIVVREPARARAAGATAAAAGLTAAVLRWSDVDFAALARGAAVVVSTVPPEAVRPHGAALASAGGVLDVIYHPWPTPLAEAALAAGKPVATGLDMLLHQAFGQVEQFTGRSAPREVMRSALRSHTGTGLPLPLG